VHSGFLTTLLGLALLAIPSLLAPALLRVRGPAAQVLTMLVAAAAGLVAVATAVSLFNRFTVGWVLAGQALVAVAAAGLWLATARPPLPRVPRPARADVIGAVRAQPIVAGFAALVGAALIVDLWQGLAVVSNGWDPMAYHLSRAAFWIQNHSVTQFTGGTVRELGYPPNAEILDAWTMLVSGADHLANVVQLVALIGTGVAIYLGARMLRFGRGGSLLAGLLFMSMPIPIMEATTAQNDDLAAFFVTTAAVLGVRGVRDRHWGEIAVGAAAVGLALGTKGIVVLAGPSLILLLGVAARRARLRPRAIAAGMAMAIAAFAVLGAYNFVENLRNTHDLYGHAREGTQRTSSFIDNTVRVDWGYVDMPGINLPWLNTAVQQIGSNFSGLQKNGFAFGVDSEPNDSQSAFGPVAPLLLLPVLLAFLLGRRAAPDRRVWAGAALLFGLLFPLSADWSPDLIRLAAIGVALGAPLLAVLARWRTLTALAAAAATAVMIPCVLLNPLRPVIVPPGAVPAYKQSRDAQYTYGRADMSGVLQRVDADLGPKAALGFAGTGDGWDYPFFGPHLEHRVVRMLDTNGVTVENMRRLGIAGVVVERLPDPTAPGLRKVRINDSFLLVRPGR
jgi:hypothetical protein